MCGIFKGADVGATVEMAQPELLDLAVTWMFAVAINIRIDLGVWRANNRMTGRMLNHPDNVLMCRHKPVAGHGVAMVKILAQKKYA
jgi:hypothetical protein